MGQTVPITFTSNCRQRPAADTTQDIIIQTVIPSEFAPFLEQPATLVGKIIKQRFQDGDDPKSCMLV